jgi:hypothetical protein
MGIHLPPHLLDLDRGLPLKEARMVGIATYSLDRGDAEVAALGAPEEHVAEGRVASRSTLSSRRRPHATLAGCGS